MAPRAHSARPPPRPRRGPTIFSDDLRVRVSEQWDEFTADSAGLNNPAPLIRATSSAMTYGTWLGRGWMNEYFTQGFTRLYVRSGWISRQFLVERTVSLPARQSVSRSLELPRRASSKRRDSLLANLLPSPGRGCYSHKMILWADVGGRERAGLGR